MKITDSAVQFLSEHVDVQRHQQVESLTMRAGQGSRTSTVTVAGDETSGDEMQVGILDRIELSSGLEQFQPVRAEAKPVSDEDADIADLNIRILRMMIERLTGKVMDIKFPQDTIPGERAGRQTPAPVATDENSSPMTIQYDYYESHYEYESTSFETIGLVETSEGQQISFSVQLNLSREFMSEERISIQSGERLKDPLVLNFDGRGVELGQRDFVFDIDLDGRAEQISFVAQGSGFLAHDRNGDGEINDGSELFGARSGDGFGELAAHDQDGNRWIDENDDIYRDLRIWMVDNEGTPQLFALGEIGVGAIYLNHTDTPFTIKDAENSTLGKVRDSGVFLNENGTAGVAQKIDLAV